MSAVAEELRLYQVHALLKGTTDSFVVMLEVTRNPHCKTGLTKYMLLRLYDEISVML